MFYLYSPDQTELYLRLLKEALPDQQIACWPDAVDADAVTHVAVWGTPPGFFAAFSRLQVIFNLGAGVDALLKRDDIPETVEIVRLHDAGMAQQMTEYCLYGVLHYQREMEIYRRQQHVGAWLPRDARLARKVRVTVLGLGEIGGRVASELARLGYTVRGWSRHARQIAQVDCRYGETALDTLLGDTDVLLCVLPATPETRHLLNAERLARLPSDAAVINAGRGSLIDEEALLALLDGEHLRFALLDVFAEEPLPEAHRLWTHPRVIVTPHVAADTVPEEAVAQIAENMRRVEAGKPMHGRVERRRGY